MKNKIVYTNYFFKCTDLKIQKVEYIKVNEERVMNTWHRKVYNKFYCSTITKDSKRLYISKYIVLSFRFFNYKFSLW